MGSHQWSTELHRLMGLPNYDEGEELSEYELQGCEADWDAVARRLETHPQEASITIGCLEGVKYPLETALLNQETPVPPRVVEGMIKACPKSIEEDIRDPLIAALYNPNITVEVWVILLPHARSFVESNPRIVHHLLRRLVFQGGQGLELLKMFLEVAPRALHNRDVASGANGALPIEIALIGGAPIEILRYLLKEGMKQNVGGRHGAGGLLALSEHSDENTVLQIVVEQYMHNMTNERRDILLDCFKAAGAAHSKLDTMEGCPPIHGAIQCAPLDVTIDLIENRVQDFHTSIDPSGRNALDIALIVAERALIREGYSIALKDSAKWREFLYQYLLKRDDGAAARRRDIGGRLPLHVAIEMRLCIQQGLDLIVNAYPHAAACYDDHGEIPLHAAVKKGMLTRQTGLECIIAACPRAAMSRDAKTGMYPFMLAGCASGSNIDTIYMMLREDPAAVQGGIHPSAQELYLAKKREEDRNKFAEERLEWQNKEAEWRRKETEWEQKEVDMERQIEALKMQRACVCPTGGVDESGRKRRRER